MENWHEHIDDYINGSLSGDFLEAFEEELKVNDSLKAAVNNYNDARKLSEGMLELDVLETLNNLSKSEGSDANKKKPEVGSSGPKGRVIDLRKWVAAASVIGILLVGGWWIKGNMDDAQRRDSILAQIERPVDPDARKSDEIADLTSFQKGKYYYWLNDFEESVKWLELALEEEKDEKTQSEGHYWLGHAYIQMWKVDEAKEAWGKSEEEVEDILQLIRVE